ncbi:PhyR family response regulator anti-anti-sigma factor, partial [Acidisphaera rubrifaciens]|uniref:PhyR family response regulator anti-anti-sigma factor n=1 Tax=Acidisphaera rubrifaciens TaxID=50715 RepID=UPI0006621CB7
MIGLHRDELIRALPYGRRYARALTGSQGTGDALVADSLRAILADPYAVEQEPRLALYAHVTGRFNAAGAAAGFGGGGPRGQGAGDEGLSVGQRQLLLLTSLEDLPLADAARIVGLDEDAADRALADARARLHASAATDVLIIEDEPIIAMDIEELVQNCGHRVVGVATTEQQAVDIARRTRPGLILADINLGIGGDGKTAVARIVESHYAPVIFVTAYPERLLTGES